MKILVAIEDEKFGRAIADFISAHEWPEASEIKLLHVMEPIYTTTLAGFPSELIDSYNEERKRAAKSLLLTVGTKVASALPLMKIVDVIAEGQPKEVIINKAKEWEADLVVVGSHGRSGIGQFLLGSVSTAILSAAPCTVMVVKLPVESKKKSEAKDANTEKVKNEKSPSVKEAAPLRN